MSERSRNMEHNQLATEEILEEHWQGNEDGEPVPA